MMHYVSYLSDNNALFIAVDKVKLVCMVSLAVDQHYILEVK